MSKHPAERADTHDLVRARTTLGDFELTVLSDGTVFPRRRSDVWRRPQADVGEARVLLMS